MMKHLLSFGAPFILSSCKNCATAFRNGSANRMGVARLMAPTAQPLVKPTAAPPPTPRMHSPPVITTSPAAVAGSSNGAGNGAEAEAEPTETTPLNVNERETHFGGVSEVVSESGNGHNAAAGDRLDPSPAAAAAAAANCLAPAAAAGAAAGAMGPGGGLSVSQRVRRVSMAMSIASEGKKVAPEISLTPRASRLGLAKACSAAYS